MKILKQWSRRKHHHNPPLLIVRRHDSTVFIYHRHRPSHRPSSLTSVIPSRVKSKRALRVYKGNRAKYPRGIKISARLRSRGGISPKLQDNYAPYSVTGGGGYKNLELG